MLKHRTREKDLIAATHVCQHWRSALIGDPSLWTPSSIKSDPDLRRTLTYIERSTDEISVDATSLRDLDTLKYLTPYIARSRSIVIQARRSSTVHLSDDFLGHQAPLLRSISLTGVHLAFESPFPLPNLTKFHSTSGRWCEFSQHERAVPVPLQLSSAGEDFLAYGQTTEDVLMDQVIPPESLVELHYNCNVAGQVLPSLRLPRPKRLLVRTPQAPRQTHKLVDISPHDGHTLLETVTTMLYHLNTSSLTLYLWSEDGTSVVFETGHQIPFCLLYATPDPTAVDWFSPQGCIPFGQITSLSIELRVASVIFPIDAFAWEDLKDLQIDLHDAGDIRGILRSFHPDTDTGVPRQSLSAISCTCRGLPGPLLEPLISLAKERKLVGHRLKSVHLSIARELDPHFLEELREHVEGFWIK